MEKSNAIYTSTSITFLKGQHYRNREQMNDCQGLRRGDSRREMAVAFKRQNEGSLQS